MACWFIWFVLVLMVGVLVLAVDLKKVMMTSPPKLAHCAPPPFLSSQYLFEALQLLRFWGKYQDLDSFLNYWMYTAIVLTVRLSLCHKITKLLKTGLPFVWSLTASHGPMSCVYIVRGQEGCEQPIKKGNKVQQEVPVKIPHLITADDLFSSFLSWYL